MYVKPEETLEQMEVLCESMRQYKRHRRQRRSEYVRQLDENTTSRQRKPSGGEQSSRAQTPTTPDRSPYKVAHVAHARCCFCLDLFKGAGGMELSFDDFLRRLLLRTVPISISDSWNEVFVILYYRCYYCSNSTIPPQGVFGTRTHT